MTIGSYVVIRAWRLGLGTLDMPGPGFIFFLAAWLLIVLGAIDLLLVLRREKGSYVSSSVGFGDRSRKVFLVLVGLLAYTSLLDTFGFFLDTFLLMTFLFKISEPTKWYIVLVGSSLAVGASYMLFEVCLKTPFPKGLLGF